MFVSELLALAAAACIALSGMLVSELNGRVDIIRLARWQMLAAFAMTAAAAAVAGGWQAIGGREFGLLALSSLFGIMIASTTYFAGIFVAGPRLTALLFTLASPFSLLLGYLFLGETVTLMQAAGVALVLVGILLAVGVRRRETVVAVEAPTTADTTGLPGEGNAFDGPTAPPPLTPPHKGEGGVNVSESPSPLWGGVRGGGLTASSAAGSITALGIALGIITALGQALGSLFARPAMEAGVDPFAAMAVRSGLAAAFYLVLMLLPIAALHAPYRFRTGNLGIAVAAAFFGTGLGMSLLMAALATGNVGIVTTLSSMTPIMILPMVWLRSGVAPLPAAWAGAAIAVAGTALISLGGA